MILLIEDTDEFKTPPERLKGYRPGKGLPKQSLPPENTETQSPAKNAETPPPENTQNPPSGDAPAA
jgi:hypothetical protein